MSSVITERSMRKYKRVFNFLWGIKRVEQARKSPAQTLCRLYVLPYVAQRVEQARKSRAKTLCRAQIACKNTVPVCCMLCSMQRSACYAAQRVGQALTSPATTLCRLHTGCYHAIIMCILIAQLLVLRGTGARTYNYTWQITFCK